MSAENSHTESKKCTKCGELKPLSDYSPKKTTKLGVQPSCKECAARWYRERYNNNPAMREAKKAYSRENPSRAAKDKWRRNNVETERAKGRRQAKEPESLVRKQLNNAIRSGAIKRQPCEVCGEERAQGHHHDYNRPLDVNWLCVLHHNAWHRVFSFEILSETKEVSDGE